MSSKNVNKKYLDKIEEFHKHNKLYYDKNSPTISDEKFDILKKEILDLEKKYNFLKSKLSPSASVGYKPSKNFFTFTLLQTLQKKFYVHVTSNRSQKIKI